MEIKLELSNTCGDDGIYPYFNIKDAYKKAIEYIERCNKKGKFAKANIYIYDNVDNTGQYLVGQIFIWSKFIGIKGIGVDFEDFWSPSEETKIKVNKLFDEVR